MMFSRNLTGIDCACAIRSPFTGPYAPARRARPWRGSRSPPSPTPSRAGTLGEQYAPTIRPDPPP